MAQAVEEQIIPVRGAKLWPMSVEAYHVLGEAGVIAENTELLHGLIYTKMAKSPLHSFLLRRLLEMFRALPLNGVFVSAEQPLTLTDSELEPDLAVVKGANDDYRAAHPQTAELVVEICVTSHLYDRSKLRAYAAGDVKECWLVLAPEKRVEVFVEPKAGAFTLSTAHGPSEILQSKIVPGISINLDQLFQG